MSNTMNITLCDSCKYQCGKNKCNSFMVMAMTMAHTHPELPKYREMTDEEIEFITKLNSCMGYDEEKKLKESDEHVRK